MVPVFTLWSIFQKPGRSPSPRKRKLRTRSHVPPNVSQQSGTGTVPSRRPILEPAAPSIVQHQQQMPAKLGQSHSSRITQGRITGVGGAIPVQDLTQAISTNQQKAVQVVIHRVCHCKHACVTLRRFDCCLFQYENAVLSHHRDPRISA